MARLERGEDSFARRGSARAILVVAGALVLLASVSYFVRQSRKGNCRYAYGETVGALRRLAYAEEAYALSNGGFYDFPECLAAPARCLPGYPENSPAFLEESFWTEGSGCYQRTFHPGPRAETATPEVPLSPSSLKSYALTATPAPAYPYDRSRAERFCVDSSGRICYTSDGTEPVVIDGLCGDPCTVLEPP